MADLLTVTTGTVDCRLVVATNDSTDQDLAFDTVAPQGFVYLTPRRNAFAATAQPAIVIPDVISLAVNEDGWATMPSPTGEPTGTTLIELPAVEGMTWQVSFDLWLPPYAWQGNVKRNRLHVAPFDIPVTAGTTTHIADYLPAGVDPSTGTVWVKGDQGEPGVGIANVTENGGKLTVTLTDGTQLPPLQLPSSSTPGPPPNLSIGTVTAGTSESDYSVTLRGTSPDYILDIKMPRGVKGNDGAGIPTGGTTGQVPARTADGGSAWTDAKTLIPEASTTAAGLMSASDKTALAAAASKSYIDTQDAATLTAAKAYTDNAKPTTANLIDKLTAPIIVSHRGGSLVHPEHSMEGYLDAVANGFLPEQDIQFLVDGTPVLCHDTTVDRTMTGVTGNVSTLSLQQWRKARIKNPITGGKTAQPLTFEDVLDKLGGSTVLVPEIKPGATTAQAKACIDMVLERNLGGSVLFQSFDYGIVKQVISAGLQCIYLLGSALPTTALSQLTADGVKWLGPSTGMTASNMDTLAAAGFKVIVYTPNTPAQVAALSSSVSGYFSDDPAWVSGRLQAEGVGRWTRGEAWPMRRIFGSRSSSTATDVVDVSDLIEINGAALRHPGGSAEVAGKTASMITIDLGHLTGGPVNRPCFIQARFLFGRHAFSETRGVGFHVWKNTSDPNALFYDAAYPGQEGFAFLLRRNGQMQGWSYTGGAAAVSLGTAVTAPALPTTGYVFKEVILRLEIASSWIGFHNLTDGISYTASMAKTGPFNLGLRIAGTEAIITDVQAGVWNEQA